MFQPGYPTNGAAQGVRPTPERIGASSGWTGQGVCIACVDSGFFPHPDFERRVRVHVQAERPTLIESLDFRETGPAHWHGTMVAAIAAGDGRTSGGRYAGVAPGADLALVAVVNPRGGLREPDILRGLRWVRDHGPRFGVRVVNLSVGGDRPCADPDHPLHSIVRELNAAGIVIVAAAGNGGKAGLVPPASAPEAITVGGVDDGNLADPAAWRVFHHSAGPGKPEILAPAAWIASPLLPGTPQARAARWLDQLLRVEADDEAQALAILRKARRDLGLASAALDDETRAAVQSHLERIKVVDARHQYVDGTSVAAAIVSGVVAQMLEANPSLTPGQVRAILMATARPLDGVSAVQQGAGVVQAGAAVAEALRLAQQGAA